MQLVTIRKSALNFALRALWLTTALVLSSPMLAWAGESPAIAPTPPSSAFTNSFFAMDTGTRGTPEAVAAMLGEIGYAGLGGSGYNIKPMRQALEARGLKLFNVYLTLKLDPTHSALTPPMKQLITDLEGSGAALWIAVDKVSNGGTALPPSSTEGDAVAVEKLRELADFAGPRGVRIALYPHTWFWLERTSDAVRLANRINLPSVGATFNLCHWLKVEGDGDAEATLRAAMPRLFSSASMARTKARRRSSIGNNSSRPWTGAAMTWARSCKLCVALATPAPSDCRLMALTASRATISPSRSKRGSDSRPQRPTGPRRNCARPSTSDLRNNETLLQKLSAALRHRHPSPLSWRGALSCRDRFAARRASGTGRGRAGARRNRASEV